MSGAASMLDASLPTFDVSLADYKRVRAAVTAIADRLHAEFEALPTVWGKATQARATVLVRQQEVLNEALAAMSDAFFDTDAQYPGAR